MPPELRRAEGQAAVELIAVLPLVAAILAVAWQLILAGHAAWAVSTAARAAARAAAVGADPTAAARAHLPRDLERSLQIAARGPGKVRVSVAVPRMISAVPVGRVQATSEFRPQQP